MYAMQWRVLSAGWGRLQVRRKKAKCVCARVPGLTCRTAAPRGRYSKFLRGEYVRTGGRKFALRVKLTPGIREAIRCVTRGPSGLNASRPDMHDRGARRGEGALEFALHYPLICTCAPASARSLAWGASRGRTCMIEGNTAWSSSCSSQSSTNVCVCLRRLLLKVRKRVRAFRLSS